MSSASDRACKTVGLFKPEWIAEVAARGLCSSDCAEGLTARRPKFVMIGKDELRLPDALMIDSPGLKTQLADDFATFVPGGFVAKIHNSVIAAIDHLTHFLYSAEQGGFFVGLEELPERELQSRIRDHLRARDVVVQEGLEVGGGETDLVLSGPLIIENKVAGRLEDPMASGPHFAWQARRYSIAMCTRVVFVVLAYRPADERAIPPLCDRIGVRIPPEAGEGFVQVRLVVPYGHDVPSHAKKPALKKDH